MQKAHSISQLILGDAEGDAVFCGRLGHCNDTGSMPTHGREGVGRNACLIPTGHAYDGDGGNLLLGTKAANAAQLAEGPSVGGITVERQLRPLLRRVVAKLPTQDVQALLLILFPHHQVQALLGKRLREHQDVSARFAQALQRTSCHVQGPVVIRTPYGDKAQSPRGDDCGQQFAVGTGRVGDQRTGVVGVEAVQDA